MNFNSSTVFTWPIAIFAAGLPVVLVFAVSLEKIGYQIWGDVPPGYPLVLLLPVTAPANQKLAFRDWSSRVNDFFDEVHTVDVHRGRL